MTPTNRSELAEAMARALALHFRSENKNTSEETVAQAARR